MGRLEKVEDSDFTTLLDELEAEREIRRLPEARVETLSMLEQGAQRYADCVEAMLKGKDRAVASLARALGAAEERERVLSQRLQLLTEGRRRGLGRFFPWKRAR